MFHRDDGPPLRFVQVAEDWPAGTADTVAALDALPVDLEATSAQAPAALREAGQGRRRDVVLAALRYRREAQG